MQIATTMGAGIAQAAVPGMAGLRDANRVLGEARIRVYDREDHVTFTVREQLVSGGLVGAREGYDTLRDAIAQLAAATTGDHVAAAAVIEREGRFFGHQLKRRDLEQGFRAPLRPSYLEADEGAEVVELRAKDRFERLRAIVDGDFTHRFRG